MRSVSGTKHSQSAMEYLMTYGWAILIIAVVLAALFELGVFGNSNFSPRAQPGNCQIFRPSGPGTGTNLNLEGACSSELPKFVASFGGSSTVSTSAAMLPSGTSPRTVTVWIYPTTESGNKGIYYYGGSNCNPDGAVFGLILDNGHLYFWGSCYDISSPYLIPIDTWSFVAANYTGSSISVFYNSQHTTYTGKYLNTCNSIACTASRIGGISGWWGGMFSGDIADMQIYNTSLSANEIQALHQEGIGGAPIDLSNLVAWYPLNGNAQDYSGNNNNGQISGATFTSQWTNSYTQP